MLLRLTSIDEDMPTQFRVAPDALRAGFFRAIECLELRGIPYYAPHRRMESVHVAVIPALYHVRKPRQAAVSVLVVCRFRMGGARWHDSDARLPMLALKSTRVWPSEVHTVYIISTHT
jgi:hypothetical protein